MTILRMRFTRLITQNLTKLSTSLGRGAFLAKSDILSATGLLPIWMGRREMRWGELIDCTLRKLARFPPLAYLLIHLEGNDITTTKNEELNAQIEHDICVIDL